MNPSNWLVLWMLGADWGVDDLSVSPSELSEIVTRHKHFYLAPLGAF